MKQDIFWFMISGVLFHPPLTLLLWEYIAEIVHFMVNEKQKEKKEDAQVKISLQGPPLVT
jgi:hypothetical protein